MHTRACTRTSRRKKELTCNDTHAHVQPDKPAQNPDGIDVERIVGFMKTCAEKGSFRYTLMEQYPELALSYSPEDIRRKADTYSYSGASQARLDRYLGEVMLLDLLEQMFHSYRDVARSILRQLCEPTIFRALREGHVVFSVGDYPKQNMERILLLAGRNHEHGPLHLAKLFRTADGMCVHGQPLSLSLSLSLCVCVCVCVSLSVCVCDGRAHLCAG